MICTVLTEPVCQRIQSLLIEELTRNRTCRKHKQLQLVSRISSRIPGLHLCGQPQDRQHLKRTALACMYQFRNTGTESSKSSRLRTMSGVRSNREPYIRVGRIVYTISNKFTNIGESSVCHFMPPTPQNSPESLPPTPPPPGLGQPTPDGYPSWSAQSQNPHPPPPGPLPHTGQE